MTVNSTIYWKRLWRWTVSKNLSTEDIQSVLGAKEVTQALFKGIQSFKPNKPELFSELQSKYPDQTKLLNVVQTLQHYIDVDVFQIWDLIKHYLCDISFGTPANALKNVAFVDTRPTFMLPNVWKFFYMNRIFMFKLLQYIIEFKSDTTHKYYKEFSKIYDSGKETLMPSLVEQFDKVISAAPPPRKIKHDFGNECVRQEWAEYNLQEQLVILQNILLLVDDQSVSEENFQKLFKAFRRHDFGKNQGYHELLEERHRELCMRVMYMEVCLFIVITFKKHHENPSSWIEAAEKYVDPELTKLQPSGEHCAMLLSWMLLSLESQDHAKMFENKYQHYGSTALKMHVFDFLMQLINSSAFSDGSKCAKIARGTIFKLLNLLCDKFDADGTLSFQSGVMQLCAELLKSPELAAEFWKLHQKTEMFGVVSLWNTALEYFPYNFSMLSTLASGIAHSTCKCSIRNLVGELKNLPVYTEIYNPNSIPLLSIDSDDAVIGREYFPLGNPSYRIEPGSRATVMERKEGTMIHFRSPYSYWTVFNNEIENCLDRKKHHNMSVSLQRVYEGTLVLEGILKALVVDKEVPTSLVGPSEGVFEVLVRLQRGASLGPLVACFEVCTALVPAFPREIHPRLINTGLLPRVLSSRADYKELAGGASLEPAAVGALLVTAEQPSGSYGFLHAYIQMLCAFNEAATDERIAMDILLPGLVLVLREVLPNVCSWRFAQPRSRQDLLGSCLQFLAMVLQQKEENHATNLLKKTCVYSLLHTENALELLKIISLGNEELERNMLEETNWVSGPGAKYLVNLQRSLAITMFALRLKPAVDKSGQMTPLEHLIFSQNKQKDHLKVVPRVTSYINHAFNRSLPVLSCRLLKRFADSFQMSLFASLDMTAYQVRVMFLDRLRDEHETVELKVAILEFVATCVGKQPGLTEAFFMMNHEKAKAEEKDNKERGLVQNKSSPNEGFEGILGYMADYLGTIKSDAKLLHSPLLACIMALFHELWKNNMQILVKKLRGNPKFWEHMTSPLFSEIQPGLRTYAQIFNVLGIELFSSRENIEPHLKEVLIQLFDTHKKHLDTWIDYIFSFKGRSDVEEVVDKVPVWLGLLTSWKDFTTIFCKCLPISLNIAHKSKLVAPCMSALLKELDDLKDGRLVVILSELYVIMLANWKDDCFENRKLNAKQIDSLLSTTTKVYDCLHPRAVRAILSICTVAISSLDYEIKANSATAQSIIRSVTNINSLELEQLLDNIKDLPKSENKSEPRKGEEEIPPVVLSLAMLEQCLDLYDDVFSGLSLWFQSSKFINKLLCCLQTCLHSRQHYHTSLAALRCITAYSRGPFSKDLLMSDVDQFLWMQLLPPKFEMNGGALAWKPQEWWRVYAYSLDFISMMVMKHGQFFASDAITFVGVHLEYLIEAILLPRQLLALEALDLCASALNLVVQLVNFEARWRMQNIHSLTSIMRSISVCLCQCVTLLLRSRRAVDSAPPAPDDNTPAPPVLHRILEILHMATLCLLSFSPGLLSLLAEPGLDPERWQPLVELHFGAPKIHETFPQLTFGTLLAAICLLTRSLNHAYHADEGSGSRSPRGRRRTCACGSPGDSRRATRSESLTSGSSVASALPWLNERLVAGALEATATLLASQALLAIRDANVPSRHKQLVRRELSSELAVYHDFVRKRILCAAHARPYLVRNKLGAWPLPADEEEVKRIEEARKETSPREDDNEQLPPPPPKRVAQDSMREYILRKHYLDKCAQTPTKGPPSPVSHSTPTSDKKKETSRSSKRVSWAETTRDSDESMDNSLQEIEHVYSNLTDVQINNDEDYFHFISVVFLYICQTDF